MRPHSGNSVDDPRRVFDTPFDLRFFYLECREKNGYRIEPIYQAAFFAILESHGLFDANYSSLIQVPAPSLPQL